MGLQKYREKRDFSRTPEPRGRTAAPSGRLGFVIQKHAASHLHYDFRLEMDGVLRSWAVPKGPSLDPADKRLAAEVEDHPLEYGAFEGTIPEGSYGAGSVIVWDRGTWTPVADPVEGYRKGRLKFTLSGEKLRGQWNLARMAPKGRDKRPTWLLIKSRDEYAREGEEADITGTRPESVVSGRLLEEVGRPKAKRPKLEVARLTGARKAALPAFIEPQLATLVDEAPADDRWIFEQKLDGFRMLCRVKDGKARFLTRNGKDWTDRLGHIADAIAKLPIKEAWLDGEIVVFDEKGVSSFQRLQNAGPREIVYCLFDLVHLDGQDLHRTPLLERKRALESLLRGADPKVLRYSEHIEGRGPEFHRQACNRGLEGVIGKLRDAPYSGTRSNAWIKVKCRKEQEFVIGGYTEPEGSREAFGAILIGVNENGKLRYAGRVGTGFNAKLLRELHARMVPLEQAQSPFVNPPRGAAARGVHWMKPELVAQVKFAEWTSDGNVRQGAFQGLREDKAAADVVHEHESHVTADETKKPKRRTSARTPAASSDDEVAGVKLTHPEKVLYPELGVTKLELARYYEAVADWLLPQLDGRPVMIVRCPAGHERTCFYQKHLKEEAPPGIEQVKIRESRTVGLYPVIREIGGVIALVQKGALEFHTWGSRADELEKPDRMIFDLDPAPEVPWAKVVEAAQLVHGLLDELGLRSFLKTTGGKGLHVVVPLARRHTWDEVKGFSEAIAVQLASALPDRFTANLMKKERTRRIFIDYLRNGRGATAVAAFSTRAREGATVSAPIEWDELSEKLDPKAFNVRTMSERLKALKKDPWTGHDAAAKQCITAKMRQRLSKKQ